MKSSAKVIYHDKNLLSKVRKEADSKFGDKNAYTKNLWILSNYKKRGGKVSYEGKKPSKKTIEESTGFAVAMKDWLASKADKWPEFFEVEEVDVQKASEENCEDSEMTSIFAYFNENVGDYESIEDFLDEVEDVDENYASYAEKEKKTLNKPFRTPGGPKKFSVYVKNDKGNIVKVNFGDPNMEIKRDSPERRKSFRARHNCDNPGPKWKARYWSCKMWSSKPVSKITAEEIHAINADLASVTEQVND